MNKKMIFALIIFAVTVVVLLFSGMKPKVSLDLIITSVTIYKSLAFLGFTLTGVFIGVLLK